MKYFCFDTAINGTFTLLLLQKEYPGQQCLFHETNDAGIWDAAPWLFVTENNVFEQINHPLASLHHTVFFESPETIDDLRQHLQSFIYKKIEDKEYFFRFWDARVLLNYLSGCSQTQLEAFYGEPIDSIYVEDENKDQLLRLQINRKNKLEKGLITKKAFFENKSIAGKEEQPTSADKIQSDKKEKDTEENTNRRRFLMD
ncbi:MAG: DUF4123 domain-containing protein [Chitinophagaceae bacterium]|nr:DUF4123 domain-containing protein [Chitinophagaceae bacterium]